METVNWEGWRDHPKPTEEEMAVYQARIDRALEQMRRDLLEYEMECLCG